jgi:hypothetical protein
MPATPGGRKAPVPPERAKQAGMTLLTGLFVGRADELSSLERILDELDRGCPGGIELAGEPGIGKTRLLTELAARAGARGHLVLSGAASEFENDLPFSVFVDAVDEYVAGLEPGRLAVLDGAVQAELAHVFPSLSALAADQQVSSQHERYRSHRAVRALLEHLAQSGPLVLVLDDFHWADPASVELFGALLRRPPAAAVLTAVALRPRQTPERLAITLERAHRSAAVTRVDLGALTLDEARQLLGERFDVARAALLYQDSGGNPFYLEQLARSPARVPQVTSAAEISLTGLGVPAAVAASLAEELTLLSDVGRLVLEGAAVAGDPFELELAAAAAATSEAVGMHAMTSSWGLTSSVPPTYRDASVSAIRSSDALSTRGPRAAGGSGRTSGARRSSGRGGRPPQHALTTSSGRRVRATSPPLPSCARPARQWHASRPKALHGGSVGRCGSSRRPRRRRTALSFCSPVPGHWRLRAVSPTVMRRRWRQRHSSRDSQVRSTRLSRPRAPALSASSGDTSTPTLVW